MRKVFCVTGTPGSGKTMFAKVLAKQVNGLYVDLGKIIKDFPEIFDAKYNRKHDTLDVNINSVVEIMLNIINSTNKSLVFDSHLSHYLPPQYVNICIIMKSDLKTLKRRLIKRKYSHEKIEDNLQSEIMEVCLNDAIEFGHKVKVVYS